MDLLFIHFYWKGILLFFSCSVSHVWLFVSPWTAACQVSLPFTNSQNLLKLMSTELMMPSNHLILCCPLLLLPSIFPSIRVFSNESALHIRWPNYWSFSNSLSNEYSRLISFDWLIWSSCSPRDSPESSPVPQLQSINSLVLSLLYGPTHIHTWRLENHSFDYMDLFWQSDVSTF